MIGFTGPQEKVTGVLGLEAHDCKYHWCSGRV